MPGDDAQMALASISHLRQALDALVVRGLRSVAGEQLRELRSLAGELDRIGATHVCAILQTLADEIDNARPSSAGTLMTAVSHARLLDRLLTLRATGETYARALSEDAEDAP